jgi:hypothetical protein
MRGGTLKATGWDVILVSMISKCTSLASVPPTETEKAELSARYPHLDAHNSKWRGGGTWDTEALGLHVEYVTSLLHDNPATS